MKASFSLLILTVGLLTARNSALALEPIHALLITGGGTHDYEHQKVLLTQGISARANVDWKIIDEGEVKTHEVTLYKQDDWAKGYDVVVHDECFGQVTNAPFVDHMVAAHTNGVGAVILHCSMHAYRMAKTDEWRKLIGVSSYRHEARRPFDVINLQPENPIMKGFPAKWRDFPDELYVITKLWPEAVALGKGISGGTNKTEEVCIWQNTYGKSHVFGTTLGHGNDTVGSDVYLDLVTRGLLWSCGKLGADGKPLPGYGPAGK